MDDMVAGSKSVAPREALTSLLNLSSGDQRSQQARHVAQTEPSVISLLGSVVQFTKQATNHDPFNNLSKDTI